MVWFLIIATSNCFYCCCWGCSDSNDGVWNDVKWNAVKWCGVMWFVVNWCAVGEVEQCVVV